MSRKMDLVLNDQNGNYMLPFFWQHGEDEDVLRDYMRAIQEAGIGAVCVESRPHPDFAGPKWWQDMDVILDEAHQRNMKVWILDDSHFPSGYANGALRGAPDEFRRQSIVYRKYTVRAGETFTLAEDQLTKAPKQKPDERDVPFFVKMGEEAAEKITFSDDRLLSVFAVKDKEITDLMPYAGGNGLNWKTPDGTEGTYSIYVLQLTRNRGGRRENINMMNREAVRLFIDTVYEAHWQHYSADFGSTIAGFFSDEPDMGNGFLYDPDIKPGCSDDADFPWSSELEEVLQERLDQYPYSLALLWENNADPVETADARFTYMDAVSKLVKECFSEQIGSWCREHNVMYIGHSIEDNDITSRTGAALGHYFRGLAGQDMAGIDLIGGQIYPQAEDADMQLGVWGKRKGAFFHYELAALAASAASIESRKKGRAMCEAFGAYGWSEGVYLEKYLMDHLMVRGINHFVPHAFSPKPFPDPDSPPHFYSHGHDPQYRHFGALMRYANRVCELLSGGRRIAPCAIAYDAESDWMGERESISLTAKVMAESQINYDFIPEDVFLEPDQYGTKIENGALIVNKNTYRLFLVPPRQYITPVLAEAVLRMQEQGIPVAFVDAYPESVAGGAVTDPEYLHKLQEIPVVRKDDLVIFAQEAFSALASGHELCFMPADKRIRYCHYIHDDGTELWFIVNENDTVFDGEIRFDGENSVSYLYDPWHNVRSRYNGHITLEPRKSIFLVSDPGWKAEELPDISYLTAPLSVNDAEELKDWKRSICTSLTYPAFSEETDVSLPDSLASEKPAFSGLVRYTGTVTVPEAGEYVLVITDAAEGVEVFADGISMGIQIVPAFRYLLSLTAGRHEIAIEVATTLEREMAVIPDRAGNTYEPDCGSGITGKVYLFKN